MTCWRWVSAASWPAVSSATEVLEVVVVPAGRTFLSEAGAEVDGAEPDIQIALCGMSIGMHRCATLLAA